MSTQSIAGLTDYSRLEGTAFRPSWIRNLTALVVGAGALGNEVVKALGLLGVARMTIVDPDTIEASNLTRSILFRTPAAIGRNKALAITEAASQLFPETESTGLACEIADIGFQDIAPADIVFSCVDTDVARVDIAWIATRLNRPVCDAGLGGPDWSHGRVAYFPGVGGACYCCLLSERRRRELLTLGESSIRSCWPPLGNSDVQNYPSTPTMAAIVGALQVELGLRGLLNADDRPAEASVVEISLDPAPRLERLGIRPSCSCPFHYKTGRRVVAPKRGTQTTVEELLGSVEAGGAHPAALVLDWPVCARARCAQCGFIWAPMRRLAWVRRFGGCPACRHQEFGALEVIRAVARDSPWAAYTLSELGLPEHHLHTVLLDGNAD